MLKWSIAVAVSFVCITALAELTVIKDFGDTVPAAPYLQEITVPNKTALRQSFQAQKEKLKNFSMDTGKLLYPNKSDFTPGVVKKKKLNMKHFGESAFFLIGPDALSVKWAKQNAVYLKKIHAIGMITNVDNARQTQKVEKETGLYLMPTKIKGLSEVIGVKHYPFLIVKNWIVQ